MTRHGLPRSDGAVLYESAGADGGWGRDAV